jgi:hypothetical protein
MNDKYTKAIKAGLIGAVLMVVVRSTRDLIFYWSITRPSVHKLVSQSAGNTPPVPTNFSNISPEVLISGFAIIFGFLLIFIVYLLAGAIAAYYIAYSVRCTSFGNVVVQNAICGAIAGATTQAVSAPLTLLFLFLMNPPKTNTNMLQWHWLSWIITEYIDMLTVAIIFGAIAALACGVIANSFCKSQATD